MPYALNIRVCEAAKPYENVTNTLTHINVNVLLKMIRSFGVPSNLTFNPLTDVLSCDFLVYLSHILWCFFRCSSIVFICSCFTWTFSSHQFMTSVFIRIVLNSERINWNDEEASQLAWSISSRDIDAIKRRKKKHFARITIQENPIIWNADVEIGYVCERQCYCST